MPRFALALCLFGLIVGCADSESTKNRETLSQLDAALKLARQAEQGFVPQGQQVGLQDYRQQTVSQVIKSLEQVAGQGPADQQAAVKHLLADYYASSARHQARLALANWGTLANDATVLLAQMIPVDRANARAMQLDVDEQPVIQALADKRRQYEQDLQQTYEPRVAEARRAIEQWDKQLDSLSAQRDEAVAQAAQLREKAFVQKGDAHVATHKQAALSEREGAKIEKQMQLITLKRDLAMSEYRIDQQQVESHTASIARLDQQLQAVEQGRDAQQQSRAEALGQKKSLGDEVFKDFQQVHGSFIDDVQQVNAQAASTAHKAVTVLDHVTARRSPMTQLDKLTVRTTHLHILAQQIMLLDNYTQTVSMLAAQAVRLMPDHAEKIAATVDELSQQRTELAEAATETALDAKEMANKLVEDEDLKDDVAKQIKQIDIYVQRIQ